MKQHKTNIISNKKTTKTFKYSPKQPLFAERCGTKKNRIRNTDALLAKHQTTHHKPRGRTLQSKSSRTRQHKSEVMKHKTKNRKPAQQSKKGNTQAISPSLMQEKTAACFSLLYSLDSQTIKPIARQKIKKHRISKKC